MADVFGIGRCVLPLDASDWDGKASGRGGGTSRNHRHLKMPGNGQRPLLLVDVDGVISLFGFSLDERPAGGFVTVDGIWHYLSATAGEHLRSLADTYELAWCTGWEEKANEYLPGALGLDGPLPCLSLSHPRDGAAANPHWKLGAIDRYAGPDRPLAWIDDDHAGAEAWAMSRPGPTLLVATAPHTGLTEREVARLLTWATSLSR